MISEDVFALVQLNPPGIELSRISNMKVDGSGPRMNKLCTLLLRRAAPGTPAVLPRALAGVPPRAAAPPVPPVDAGIAL
jgi:hypothetical protein